MTASRVDGPERSFAARLTCALILAALAAAPAYASDGPTSLLPGRDQGDAPAPPGGTPLPLTPPRESFPEVSPRSQRIQVQDLGAPDAGTAGLLDAGHGGFAVDMWAGSSLALVQKALPGLPAAVPSPATHALMRRLLLTSAAAPRGRGAGENSLILLRARQLWAMGEVTALARLLKGIPSAAMTPALRRLLADAALAAGDDGAACGAIDDLRGALGADPFPAKLQVYCQIAGGHVNEAGLGVDVLREQKVADPIFFAAADTAAGIGAGRLGNDAWTQASALDLAMARTAKLPLPDGAVQRIGSLALLEMVAAQPKASVEAKLLAAERTAAAGAVAMDALRQVYEGVAFSPQELAAPVTDKSPRGRALLYRASVQQTLPAAKVEIIGKALATDGDAYLLAARLYAPQIAALKPQPELAGFAGAAARALYAAGETDAARGWAALLRGPGAPERSAADALWVLQTLAGHEGDRPVPAGALTAWRQARPDLPPAAAQRRLAVAYGLLSAFGLKVPSEEWLPLFDAPSLADEPATGPAVWHGLRIAAEDLRLGETVLMALSSLNEAGLAHTSATDLYRAVAALRLIGLDDDARVLAVEAAVVNGV